MGYFYGRLLGAFATGRPSFPLHVRSGRLDGVENGGPKQLAAFSSSFKPNDSRLAETGNQVILPSK